MHNLGICHRCEHSKGCGRACTCKADPLGRDIIDLVRADECPIGRFGAGRIRPDSTIEHVLDVLAHDANPSLNPTQRNWDNVKAAYRQVAGDFHALWPNCRIWHVYHQPGVPLGPDEDRRNAHARGTWGGEHVTLLPFTAARTAQDFPFGDPRPLAFINDLFDHACLHAGPDDIVLWSNLDVCFVATACDRVREALAYSDACYSRRRNVDDATVLPHDLSDEFPGGDLFAFRPQWWRWRRASMPEMFLACECFDAILMRMMDRDVGRAELRPRVLYHERHGEPHWMRNPTSPAQKHNNRVGAEFAKSIGLASTVRGDGTFEVHWEQRPPRPPDWKGHATYPCPTAGHIGRLRDLLRRFPRQMEYDEPPPTPLTPRSEPVARLRRHEPLVIVEHGHHGDLLHLLPALKFLQEQGHEVVYVHGRGHGECAEDLPWLRCVEYTSDADAAQLGRVLHRPPVAMTASPGAPNWAQISWDRTGVPLELRHTLPLVLDNRRPAAEAELARRHRLTRRPLLLVNCLGKSSPYAHGPKLLAHLRDTFKGCEILDLAGVRAEKFRDLLGLYEVADALVTIDTGTVHLSNVELNRGDGQKLPTICLLPDNAWKAAEPRPHWKLHLTHSDSITPEGLDAIDSAIGQILVGNRQPVSFARKLAHGAAGIARAAAGLGGAADQVVQTRLAACAQCANVVLRDTVLAACRICSCNLQAKARNAAESCPIGRWPAVAPA